MKLIVGLGNPGDKYKNTRHNLGFLIIDNLIENLSINIDNTKFNGEFAVLKLEDEKVIIAKPKTFMNNSGNFVNEICRYFKIDTKDILVIQDDKDQSIGDFKITHKGSSGGQNGIKDIIEKLGTDSFGRLKVGVGHPGQEEETASYVLSNFSAEQKQILFSKMDVLTNIAKDFMNVNLLDLENKYNGKK